MMREKQYTRTAMKVLKQELFRWACERHATNSILDKRQLHEKTLELTKSFGLTEFKWSSKWMWSFLKEHSIVTDPMNLSQLDPIFSNYRDWIEMMRSTITKYKYRDLFHVDELSMYSDVPPSRILSSNKIVGDPDDCETPRNKITVLLGCNSSGSTKLPLLVCGPYSSRTTTKDHVYCHSEDSTISDDLFKNWLTALNDRMSRANRKILLFLRRSRSRALRDFPLSNVNLIYLPAEFPSTLRPLQKDVFHYVKMIFRRRYAERLKRHTSEWNLRDILESLIEAWETLPREIVVYNFQRTHFRTDDNFLQIDCDCWNSLDTGISFKRFVTFDDDLSDSRYHGYNLRTSSREMVQLSEDSEDSIPDEIDKIEETMLDESLNESIRDHSVECTGLDKCVSGRRGCSPGNLEPKESTGSKKRKESLNGTFEDSSPKFFGWEACSPGNQEPKEATGSKKRKESLNGTFEDGSPKFFGAGEQQGASRETPGNMKNTFAARDAGLGGSIGSEAFKRTHQVPRHQTESNNVAGSIQAIIDKALTRTTTAKADYARKLIADIYALNQETGSSANSDPSIGEDALNEGARMSSKAPIEYHESCRPSDSANCTEVSGEIVREEASCLLEEAATHRTIEANTTKKRRMSSDTNDLNNDEDSNASAKKKPKRDCEWFKEFETTFVFGNQHSANCSSSHERDDNIAVSCIVNVTPASSPRN